VATLGMAALAKWLVVSAVVAGGTAAVVSQAPSRTDEPAATNARPTASAPVTTPGKPARSAPSEELPTISPADLPAASATTATTAAPTAPPARSATPAHDETLAAEIALFDRVRAAVGANEPDRALGLLDDYERRFPAGAFRQEAEVVRVQALLQKGDRAAANRAGERFLAAHPTSPHAARLRAMLHSSTP
jgi:TolA-binding protein